MLTHRSHRSSHIAQGALGSLKKESQSPTPFEIINFLGSKGHRTPLIAGTRLTQPEN